MAWSEGFDLYITGKKVKLLLEQIKNDVLFFKDKEVNEEYLNAFKFISKKGLKKYERMYRQKG